MTVTYLDNGKDSAHCLMSADYIQSRPIEPAHAYAVKIARKCCSIRSLIVIYSDGSGFTGRHFLSSSAQKHNERFPKGVIMKRIITAITVALSSVMLFSFVFGTLPSRNGVISELHPVSALAQSLDGSIAPTARRVSRVSAKTGITKEKDNGSEAAEAKADEGDVVIEDEPAEDGSPDESLPEICASAEHNGYRYDIRSFEISPALPDGVTLEDTTQSFGYFSTYDENGFLVSQGDSVASHLSESGEYDGYLGKEYVWAVLRFDLTSLGGKDEYINVGGLNLSFGKYKKVKYCGKMRWRYSGFVSVGYMNLHDVMPEIPEYMQYYTLHLDAGETKQLTFCYLIEKKYSDETFYLEMNIHSDGESYDYLKIG